MRFLIACIFVAVATSSWADGPGQLQIVDGDTIYLGVEKIRLQGIDAPETEQMCLDISGRSFACGLDAKSALARRFEGRLWSCRASGTDRYRRTLATCFVDGEDVGQWLVREGWALAFRRYSNAYLADEDDARSAKRGLWSGAFIAPWDWRARSSQTVVLGAASVPVSASRLLTGTASEVSPSSGCTIKGNLRSKPACIYHLPGGRFYGGLDMTEHAARRWFCSEAEAQAAGCRRSKL
ncbi:thermonuclease family protein [Tardiphaga alba]|uniref:Thermonuclease family protein n=1 Tax=Tardiphaga alba TaxID=340268 RepID=A0ABX8A3P3_9BRAD|nr:thermonuclease family protein [Tardiphaga alba]QUS38082.1 thermonuclease family protein [Tardiphaga alba]